MKSCSIKNPWANLICLGIKDIENRTWRTNFRGKIYVHVPGKNLDIHKIPFTAEQAAAMNNKKGIISNISSAIIGTVDIIDCVRDHKSIWAEEDCWHWVLDNPVMFDEPILNVKGKLSLWDYTPFENRNCSEIDCDNNLDKYCIAEECKLNVKEK
jgi:hypothetical protein